MNTSLYEWIKTQFKQQQTDEARGYNDALLDMMNKIKEEENEHLKS